MKGWVYFARLSTDGPIKIGYSIHPHRRVSSLASASPYPITLLAAMQSDDAPVEEQLLHERLATVRIKGEWFFAPAVLEELERLAPRLVPLEQLPPINAAVDERARVPPLPDLSVHVEDLSADVSVVLERLRRALGNMRGLLQVPSALVLAGFSSPTYLKYHMIARSLRELGWERGRFRFKGSLLYAYAKGSQLDREYMLFVDRGADDRLVVTRREP